MDGVPAAVMDQTELVIEKGDSKVLTVLFSRAGLEDKPAVWTSSRPDIATVADGVVVGISAGRAVITALTDDYLAECDVVVVVSATSITVEPGEVKMAPVKTVTLQATVLPEDCTDEVEWFSSDETVATVNDGVVSAWIDGSATITARAGSQSASCSVVVESKVKAVDMGLSVMWGDVNLGAEKPEDFGNYYAWGEVEPKGDYSWETYKWAEGSHLKITKYCEDRFWAGKGLPDKKIVLDPEDDAAHVKLGIKWRIPTIEEWEELMTNCTWFWTQNYNGTRTRGRIVTAANGNSIFLPACGQRLHTFYYSDDGYYWSSSRDKDEPAQAWFVTFNMGVAHARISYYRNFGYSIRPVSD